jgi:hypothetical protein
VIVREYMPLQTVLVTKILVLLLKLPFLQLKSRISFVDQLIPHIVRLPVWLPLALEEIPMRAKKQMSNASCSTHWQL